MLYQVMRSPTKDCEAETHIKFFHSKKEARKFIDEQVDGNIFTREYYYCYRLYACDPDVRKWIGGRSLVYSNPKAD